MKHIIKTKCVYMQTLKDFVPDTHKLCNRMNNLFDNKSAWIGNNTILKEILSCFCEQMKYQIKIISR